MGKEEGLRKVTGRRAKGCVGKGLRVGKGVGLEVGKG